MIMYRLISYRLIAMIYVVSVWAYHILTQTDKHVTPDAASYLHCKAIIAWLIIKALFLIETYFIASGGSRGGGS